MLFYLFGESADDHEGMFQFMGHVCGGMSDGSQAFRLPDDGLPVCDVQRLSL
jgi:hypothetical protein